MMECRHITRDMVKNKLPKRCSSFHKGNFGKLMCICGSKSMPGAAKFCISGALRCGVGIVRAAIPEAIYMPVSSEISECTYIICENDEFGGISLNSLDLILQDLRKCEAVAMGCGMGWTKNTKFLVYNLIKSCKSPMIIDADGINVVSENINILKEATNNLVFTPHIGEAGKLLNVSAEEIKSKKIQYAKKLAEILGAVVVLKDCETVVADKGEAIFLYSGENSGMAKGGSGDILSGMIGSFLAQGLPTIDAAICAVYIHGESGKICKKKYSSAAMLPSDLVKNISKVFINFENEAI